ncbi:vWA domain-containing protein [Limnoglobus roseus]|uniref:VWA domain-containing protein n=1 Tax=Limnoglobus roseus TaxID=2598579 RepID=A0A5C1AJY3_9BACT|nr:vWA domain-containing protein [Limnoglobus roseus]QEL18002.1 hypothetical protein PX52LOC_05016 [Limnoglobus roseus]
MRQDLTDITVVMDRSGSMQACQADAEGGLNRFVEDQKKLPGEATFTLVQFDHEYEFVHKAIPIRTVPYCRLVPRGNTALLDAVGRAIVETGERLAKTPEADRPALVVFVITTDGQENASREYTKAKVQEMISHQTDVYKWQFTYLGANQDSFGEAGAMGIPMSGTANFTAATARVAYASASAQVGRMRTQAKSSQPIDNAFTTTEIEDMEGKKGSK